MAQRTAHTLANPGVLDTLQLGPEMSLVEVAPPGELIGHTLAELSLRQRYRVSVVAVRHTLRDVTRVNPDPTALVTDSDVLIVLGRTEDIDRFGSRKK